VDLPPKIIFPIKFTYPSLHCLHVLTEIEYEISPSEVNAVEEKLQVQVLAKVVHDARYIADWRKAHKYLSVKSTPSLMIEVYPLSQEIYQARHPYYPLELTVVTRYFYPFRERQKVHRDHQDRYRGLLQA
jgi:hypothetical protein